LEFCNRLLEFSRVHVGAKKDFTPTLEKISSDKQEIPKKGMKSLVYSPTNPVFLRRIDGT
jgi:hypothetical protein